MTIDLEFDDDGPPELISASDVQVIAAVHGAYHAMTRRLDLSTRQHGLETAEALVLAAVLREPGCSPGQLRGWLGFHRSTLASILDRLERDGLIDRAPSSFDGRRFEIRLTPRGVIAAEIADFVISDVEAELATYTQRWERLGARSVFDACVAIGRPSRGSER